MKRSLRLLCWCAALAAVVDASRWLAYRLAPASPAQAELEHATGGPRPLVVALVIVALALGAAAGVLWLAALFVRERAFLQTGGGGAGPHLDVRRFALRTLGLFVVSSLTFSALESYLHVRAGLGFHGLHCLLGPVHRDALPLLGAFSALAAALVAALEHVFAWMRRTIAALRRARGAGGAARPASLHAPLGRVPQVALAGSLGSRGPPLPL